MFINVTAVAVCIALSILGILPTNVRTETGEMYAYCVKAFFIFIAELAFYFIVLLIFGFIRFSNIGA